MSTSRTVFHDLGTTVFETMSRLAEAHGAVNLGQGFPDEGGPAEIVEEARRWLGEESNQYPPMAGLPVLRRAIAAHELAHYDLERDPQGEVLVTSGATEALGACILALVAPGDEVLVFEPLYDSYLPMIRRAGGVPVPVRLAAPAFALDAEALRRAASPRTRMILINDPQNPAGKAWSEAELAAVAAVAEERDAVLVCDEVYEHLVFDGRRHTPLAQRAALRGRALKIGSAGKIFSMTGWKVGWVTGPASLVGVVARAHQYLTFTTPPNLQAAVALGLARCGPWVEELTRALERKRDHLARGLGERGFRVLSAGGTYFLNVDLRGTPWEGRDDDFCRDLTERRGVTAIPLRAFYAEGPERSVVRFCFAKRYEVLDEALRRLELSARATEGA